MSDLRDIESVLENQLVMVSTIPSDEDQSASSGGHGQPKSKTPMVKSGTGSKPRNVPDALKNPTNQTEMLKARIRVFWLLRFLVMFLTKYNSDLNRMIKTNPMLSEQREVESWEEGQ